MKKTARPSSRISSTTKSAATKSVGSDKSKISSFSSACYKILSQVPRGKVTTYRLIAKALGSRAVRAVGTAMAKNPFAPRIPCHRVVRSDGSVGEYNGGAEKKQLMLRREGIQINNGKVSDLSDVLFAPKPSKKAPKTRRAPTSKSR